MSSEYFNKEGHLNDEGISLFVDALQLEKTDELPVEIKGHIDQCEACHLEGVNLFSIIGGSNFQGEGEHPVLEKRKVPVRRLIYRIVAAAFLAGFAFYFFQLSNQSEVPNDQVIVNQDTINNDDPAPFVDIPKDETKIGEEEKYKAPDTKQPKSKNQIPKAIEQDNRQLFAMNYTPNSEFEDFVGEVYRSSALKIDSPQNGISFNQGTIIPFAWKDNGNSNWTIIVFNNRGAEMGKADITKPGFAFQEKWPPGLYYWRLETLDDLLHVGKFTIE